MDNSELFELELELPNSRLTAQANRLVGFAERYDRLHRDLRLIIDVDGLVRWSQKFYGSRIPLIDVVTDRYPLVIFHGDVGNGKTAMAEAFSNALAKELEREAWLFKLSTRVRGAGTVGQMSTLINQAFQVVIQQIGKTRLSFLIIDEADSLGGSREMNQSHHEDKVAVNTLIQKIDDVRQFNGRVLIFLCTNRFSALDPALVRRAARIEQFDRPNDQEREALLRIDMDGLNIPETVIDELVVLTGPHSHEHTLGFTYSDLRTRLLPEAIALAYPNRPIDPEDLLEVARNIQPSPSFRVNGHEEGVR